MERQTFVDIASNLLAQYGFGLNKSANVFVKSAGGSASSCVKFYYLSDQYYENILNPLKNKECWPHNISTSFVLLTDDYKIDKEELQTAVKIMKNNGFVGDLILVDLNLEEIYVAGSKNTFNRDVGICLNKAIKGEITKQKPLRIPYYGKANYWLVFLLVAINVAIYLAEIAIEAFCGVDYIYLYGVQYNPNILNGEWWRLITPLFLHADIIHLAGNMLTLIYFGKLCAQSYKKWIFLLIYFISGLFGNILTLLFLDGVSLGASGAIMGLGGVIVYKILLSRERKLYRSYGNYFYMGILVLYNLLYGIFNVDANVNNFGHFGGFIAGFLIALLIEKAMISKQNKENTESQKDSV